MEKKKLLFMFDTDNAEVISKVQESLKEGIIIIPQGVAEIWEIDSDNNMRRIY